jgi:hypothetical protein
LCIDRARDFTESSNYQALNTKNLLSSLGKLSYSSKFAVFALLLLLIAVAPSVVPRAHAQSGGSVTYVLDGSESDCGYTLANSVSSNTQILASDGINFCAKYEGSTQTISSVTMTLNYYTEVEPPVTIGLFDSTTEASLADVKGAALAAGGSCDDPLQTTLTLSVNSGAQLISGDEIELSVTGDIFVVTGSGSCDPSLDSGVTIGFTSSAAPPVNPCQLGLSCSTAFAVFNVLQPTGAPVGGATVMLSATGLTTQTLTTASATSTSLLCTESPSWTAMWGAYWGCNAGETGQFILEVGVTYSYTVTISEGNVITGTLGPSTTPGTSAWTVTIVPVTS